MTIDEIIKSDPDLCRASVCGNVDELIKLLTEKRDELAANFMPLNPDELSVLAKAQCAWAIEAIEAGKITTYDGLFAFLGFGPPPKTFIDAVK